MQLASYSGRLPAVFTQVCVFHTLELYSLTKHLFCTHARAHARSFLVVPHPPHAERSAASLMLAPIDHHYYCSLLIPMEMRPAAAVLGDWGRGLGPRSGAEVRVRLPRLLFRIKSS